VTRRRQPGIERLTSNFELLPLLLIIS